MNKEEEENDNRDDNDDGDVVEDETSKIILEKKSQKIIKSMKNVFTSQTLFNFSACWPATWRSGIKTKGNKRNKKYSLLFYFNKCPGIYLV